jgi:GntR family transcriptional regulator
MARRPSRVEEVRRGLLGDLGALERGAKLPNEDALAHRFGVSRATVREAVLGLLEAGYLSRRHGSGTFVADPPRGRHALDATVSYTAMIREAGFSPGELVLGKVLRAPTAQERERLVLAGGEELVEVERVRLADRRRVIYSRDRIPQTVLGDVAREALDSSLYAILEWAGHRVVRASARLTPVLADAAVAALLEVQEGAPLLHIDQVDLDERGRPVMLSAEWHVADAFELIVNRRAAGP